MNDAKRDDYRDKRDFGATPEPAGDGDGRPAGAGSPLVVIQEHDASSLHWDFRLEVDGVLKSWAVPKGPSTDPRERRLALPTEDHPLAYAGFEGVIPADEYGGGTVVVWDRGTWENATTDDDGEPVEPADAVANGHLTARLHGEKLQGEFALHRTGDGEDARWLLIKAKDDGADARRNPVSTQPESVLSGRTRDEIAAEEGDDDD